MTDQQNTLRGSTAHAPDLNWSQVKETVLMLELAAVQIEAAMKDSNASVDLLTDSFTSMAGHMRMIADTVNGMPATAETASARESLLGVTERVSGSMHQAIVAFQFYDKLVQRLAHVGHSLGALSSLVSDQNRLFNPGEWVGLQEKIRSKYTTHEETVMFEAIIQGKSVQQAIDAYMSDMKEKGSDVEFF